MIFSTHITTIAHWLCRFLYVQCFVSLISLPILMSWGLPLSFYSPLGNLIFGPIITLFLIVSCLVFFCELLHIPNVFFVWCLEYITLAWQYLLSYGQHEWLIGFAQPPLVFLCALPLCALGLLFFLAALPVWRKTLIMIVVLTTVCGALNVLTPKIQPLIMLPCNGGHIALVTHKGKLGVIDPGVIGQRQSAVSWMQYTFASYLVRTTGRTSIDYFVLLNPNRTTLKAVIALCQKIGVHNLYLAPGKYSLEKEFVSALDSLQVNVVSLDSVPVVLGDTPNCLGTLKPLVKRVKRNGIQNSAFVFYSTIDNNPVTIYPSGYTKRNKDA